MEYMLRNLYFILSPFLVFTMKSVFCMTTTYGVRATNFVSYKAEGIVGPKMSNHKCISEGKCWSVNYDRVHLSGNMINNNGSTPIFEDDSAYSYTSFTSQDKLCSSVQCSSFERCVTLKSGIQICINNEIVPDTITTTSTTTTTTTPPISSNCQNPDYLGTTANITWSSLFIGYDDPSLDRNSAWSPPNDQQNADQYIQFGFHLTKTLVGVATKGLGTSGHYVTSYQMLYLDNQGSSWLTVQNSQGQNHVFTGNNGSDTLVTNYLDVGVTSTAFRLNPLTWNSHICLRVDLIGC